MIYCLYCGYQYPLAAMYPEDNRYCSEDCSDNMHKREVNKALDQLVADGRILKVTSHSPDDDMFYLANHS